MTAPYVPLRILSCYSMLEGAIDPKAIAARARALGLPAAALTDRNGLYAAMPFTEACYKEGIQPIVGTLLGVARPGHGDQIDWLPLYAQDERGYSNLCALVSAAHLGRPIETDAHVALAALAGRTDGLIALTGGREGALSRLLAEGQRSAAEQLLLQLEALFPDRLYIELTRRGDPVESAAEAALIELADTRALPLIATNPASYAEAGFHQAHDAMLCIAQSSQLDRTDRTRSSPEAWIKSADDMRAAFADLPEALENTAALARRCAFGAPKRKPILPSIAGDLADEAAQLRRDARAGLIARLNAAGANLNPALATLNPAIAKPNTTLPELVEGPSFSSSDEEEGQGFDKLSQSGWEVPEELRPYFTRLDFECDVIIKMGFPGYFLIVADFIKWAKEQGIPVGPGRGSGAGSVVAWALTITDLDPIKLGLLFERFLNPERVSMPDFDIDFCETRRGEVIRYVQQRYGADKVAQIITFGKLKARAVLKDTGRVLQMPYGQVDRLAKLVPNHPTDPWTLERALNGVSELAAEYKSDGQVRRLFDLAKQLEGLPRHSSTHAAGVVIGDRPLSQLVPLYRDPRSDTPVTQFDLKYVEAAGLVKFDFLGLKTLSVLRRAVELLEQRGIHIDLDRLSWDDELTYKLLQRGDTVGVFQVESEGMRRTLSAVKPTVFEDIIALGALYRPGPMDNIPLFGARKNGREPIEYPHPLLEEVLKETYGIFVYQEQVMEAAKVLAGYSLGEADLLRRAMGKKIQAEMDAQRERFVTGCAANQIARPKANELFDLIDKFAGYGFNKSHAAAYALLTYQTAWLKAHYPVEFYAASMCFDMHQTDKLAIFIDDMRRGGHLCLPPSINFSHAEFAVEAISRSALPELVEGPSFASSGAAEEGQAFDKLRQSGDGGYAVRYALGALKGVGEKAMEQLVSERTDRGAYASIEDFAARIDPRLNRRQLESLAGAGAFDELSERAAAFAAAETILAVASSAADARSTGQGGLFGEGPANVVPIRAPKAADWSLAERMAQEKEAFGFYFSAHPVDRYRHLADANNARTFGALAAMPPPAEGVRTGATMAAMVEEARWRTSQKGRRFLMARLSDNSGQFDATVFDDDAALQVEKAAKEGACVLLGVELDRRPGEETPRVTIRSVTGFDGLSRRTRLQLELEANDPAALPALARLLLDHRGGSSAIRIRVHHGTGWADLLLGRDFLLDAELAAQVERIPGIVDVRLTAEAKPQLQLVS